METEANLYSRQWFEFFHAEIDAQRTIRETEFVCRGAPLPEFQRILDVWCGTGRHAHALGKRGYIVTGVDRDVEAIAAARTVNNTAKFVVSDVRDYEFSPTSCDAVIAMGQSFGQFDAPTNFELLSRFGRSVRNRGRIVLDLWNPEFFRAHQGYRELKSPRGSVTEHKRVDRDRLFVELSYPDGGKENFEWQLFTPGEMKQLAESAGLVLAICCSDFDATTDISPDKPRIQFLLEREP